MEFTQLPPWYASEGRHGLPWRQAISPWRVLVSELMLQQTPVSRVLGRYTAFLQRWPTAEAMAATPLEEVLRAWQGLGYPRRARNLWLAAGSVAASGWPQDEAGLRSLPGVGVYTARAMLWICQGEGRSAPPRDVNLSRIAARTRLGQEPEGQPASLLDSILAGAQPAGMVRRDYVYALFDLGSHHCRATPHCDGCPLQATCAWHGAPQPPRQTRRRQAAYAGSLRQLRGRLLALALEGIGGGGRQALLASPQLTDWSEATVAAALDSLVREELLPVDWSDTTEVAAGVAP